MFLRIEGIPASFYLTSLSFLGTFSASVGTKIYVECTSSSFAVNRDNWEGVVDEGKEYIPANEMVVCDVSQPFSVICYEIPELFGISTTPPPSPHSIKWITAPIAFVLFISLIILILYCTFNSHLIPSDHNTQSTNTNDGNTSPHTTRSTHNLVAYASDASSETEIVNENKIEYGFPSLPLLSFLCDRFHCPRMSSFSQSFYRCRDDSIFSDYANVLIVSILPFLLYFDNFVAYDIKVSKQIPEMQIY